MTSSVRRQEGGDRVVAAAWVAAAVVSAAIALIQYFGVSATLSPWLNTTNVGEAYANLRQRNQFATLTNIGLVALVWWRIHIRPSDIRGAAAPYMQWLVYVAAMLLAAGTAASSSRTGLLQLLVLFVLACVWRCSTPGPNAQIAGRLLSVAGMSYCLATLMLPALAGLDVESSGILGRLHESSPDCASRVTLWSNVLHLIAQKPWFGWGWGELDYAHFMAQYPGLRFCDILDNAHNLPLHLAVELGIPLSAAFCSVCVWLVIRAKPWRDTDPTRRMAWSILVLIGVHSLLEYPLWYGPFQMATALAIYLLWSAPVASGEAKAAHSPLGVLSLRGVSLATFVLIGALAYAAWDYWRVSQIYLPHEERASDYRENTAEKIQDSYLFRDQVRFAALSTTPLTRENAESQLELSREMLHFSPEPRVVERLLDSAWLLGREDVLRMYLDRYKRAFPAEQARWIANNTPTAN